MTRLMVFRFARPGPLSCRLFSLEASTARPNGVRPMEDIPGPRALPGIGTIYKYLPGGEYDLRDALGTSMKKYKKYGPIVREQLLPGIQQVFVYTPEDVQTVFQHEGKYPSRGPALLGGLIEYRKLRKTSPGLPGQDGPGWHALRSPLQRLMMRPQIVLSYVPALAPIDDELVELTRLKRDQNEEIHDFIPLLSRWSMEQMGLICFDARLGTLDPDLADDSRAMEIIHAVDGAVDGLYQTTFFWDIHRRLPTGVFAKYCADSDLVNGRVLAYIEDALERDRRGEPGILQDKMSVLVEAMRNPDLTPEETFISVVDLFTGGVDTTGTTAGILLYNLAMNQDKQEILYQHIKENIDPDKPIDATTLESLPYLKACLKESMRILPTVPGTIRALDKDIILSGYNVSKGTLITLASDVMGQLPEYFPEPERFLPERWFRTEQGDSRQRQFVSIPFGHGPRSCIGRRFAELEIHLLMIKFLSAFRVEYNGEKMGVTCRLVNKFDRPLRLKFIDR